MRDFPFSRKTATAVLDAILQYLHRKAVHAEIVAKDLWNPTIYNNLLQQTSSFFITAILMKYKCIAVVILNIYILRGSVATHLMRSGEFFVIPEKVS